MSISIASKYIDGMRKGFGVDLFVTVDPLSGSSFKLTKANIVQGSFEIDRSVCSGDVLEIGSAMAAEMSFTIKNESFKDPDGNNVIPALVIFEGAELTVNLTLYNPTDSETFTLPLGIFTVDEPPRKLSTITIKALDRMMRFDVAHDGTVGTSLLAVAQHCCTLAGVTLSASAVTFLNNFAGVYTLPDSLSDVEDLACRQVLMWVGEMTASCAYIDENGYLDFKQYPQTHLGAMVITESDRYSSDMQESDITITGITVTSTDSESEAVTIGAQGYEWNIEGNQLLVSPDEMAAAPLGYSNYKFFSYRPFTANTKSFPHLWPMDAVVFSKRNPDGESKDYNSVITHHTWKLNGISVLKSVGKSAVKNGYATHGGLTAKQKAVIERTARNQGKKQISGYQQAIIDINEVAQRATGLYNTTDEDAGITYYHNQPDIADSTYIYMESSAGRFMATGANAWNNGAPVWTNAWSAMGQLVANSIAAGSITTDLLSVGSQVKIKNLIRYSDFCNVPYGVYKRNAAQSFDMSSNGSFGTAEVGRGVGRFLQGSTEFTGDATDSYIVNRELIEVIAKQNYVASFYIKRETASDNRWVRMHIEWLESDKATVAGRIDINATGYFAAWARYHNVVTAPEDAAYARIYIYTSVVEAYRNNYLYFCGLAFTEGDKLYDWDCIENPQKGNVLINESGVEIYGGSITIYDSNGNKAFRTGRTGELSVTGNIEVAFKSDDNTDTATLKITNEDYKSSGYATATIKVEDSSGSVFSNISMWKTNGIGTTSIKSDIIELSNTDGDISINLIDDQDGQGVQINGTIAVIGNLGLTQGAITTSSDAFAGYEHIRKDGKIYGKLKPGVGVLSYTESLDFDSYNLASQITNIGGADYYVVSMKEKKLIQLSQLRSVSGVKSLYVSFTGGRYGWAKYYLAYTTTEDGPLILDENCLLLTLHDSNHLRVTVEDATLPENAVQWCVAVYPDQAHDTYYAGWRNVTIKENRVMPTAALELQDSAENIMCRLDCFASYGEALIALQGKVGTATTGRLEFGADKLYWGGGIVAERVEGSSDVSLKTNIKNASNMLDKVREAGIYSYNYKSELCGKTKNNVIPRYGLVIGEGYNTPSEVISSDGKHIDLYSMIALAWKAIQELADRIDTEVIHNAE